METVRISRPTWNKIARMLKQFNNGVGNNNSGRRQAEPNIRIIKNSTGEDRSQCEILGIGGVEVLPADDFAEFHSRSVFTGEIPTTASHANGRFAILAEPIADGEYGRAYINNIAVVQINVTDEAHCFADIADGVTANLESTTSGPCVILWKETGTGTKWGIVRFSGGGGTRLAYCKVASGTGSTIACYLDMDLTGEVVTVNCSICGATNLNDAIPRLPVGQLIFVENIAGNWYCKTVFQKSKDC